MRFLSPRALKASLSSGPLEITLMVVHFHHKPSRRQAQWNEIAKELHGPNLILCADHNSLTVKHRDALVPLEFQHDTSLRAREQQVAALAKAGLHDVLVDIHCPTLMDIKDTESSCPTGFTYGYPREGEQLDPQRLRCIDRIHGTSELLSLATSVYPIFAANLDHKAVLAEFTPPSFETEGTTSRFYCPEAISTTQWKNCRPPSNPLPRWETNGGKMRWAASTKRRSIIKENTKIKRSRPNSRRGDSCVSPRKNRSRRWCIKSFHRWE